MLGQLGPGRILCKRRKKWRNKKNAEATRLCYSVFWSVVERYVHGKRYTTRGNRIQSNRGLAEHVLMHHSQAHSSLAEKNKRARPTIYVRERVAAYLRSLLRHDTPSVPFFIMRPSHPLTRENILSSSTEWWGGVGVMRAQHSTAQHDGSLPT